MHVDVQKRRINKEDIQLILAKISGSKKRCWKVVTILIAKMLIK